MCGVGIDLVEYHSLQDIFVSGLGDVEDVGGGCVRLRFYVREQSLVTAGEAKNVVALRAVMPVPGVTDCIKMLTKALGRLMLNRTGIKRPAGQPVLQIASRRH